MQKLSLFSYCLLFLAGLSGPNLDRIIRGGQIIQPKMEISNLIICAKTGQRTKSNGGRERVKRAHSSLKKGRGIYTPPRIIRYKCPSPSSSLSELGKLAPPLLQGDWGINAPPLLQA
jgi:hypothetical protein